MIYKLIEINKEKKSSKSWHKGNIIFEQKNTNGFLEYIFEKGFKENVYEVWSKHDDGYSESISIGLSDEDQCLMEKGLKFDEIEKIINQ